MFNELWEDFKRAIVPKSHAEAIVDQIYGPENKGVIGSGYENVPIFHSGYGAYPQLVVRPAATVIDIVGGIKESIGTATTKFGTLASDTAKSLAMWLMAAAIVLVVVYAFAKK